jgi:hypothetical protein
VNTRLRYAHAQVDMMTNLPPLLGSQGAHPLVNGVWLVFEDTELTFLRASCLQADMVFGISPVDADEGRKLFSR